MKKKDNFKEICVKINALPSVWQQIHTQICLYWPFLERGKIKN